MDDADLMALMRRFGKAFNRGDVETILECVTEDFEWIMPSGPDPPHGRIVRGKAELAKALAERAAQMPEVRFSDGVIVNGDQVVVGTFRARGKRASGERFDVRGCDLYTLRHGKIARKDSYWKQIP
jgi:taurine dehydrogenase small subunit